MSDTPRTDEQAQSDAAKYAGHSRDYVSLLNFARELERELNELVEDRDYYESSLRKVEDRELNLMKDKERLDWLLNNHMVKGEWETSEDDDRIQYQVIYPDREAIDKAISSGDR